MNWKLNWYQYVAVLAAVLGLIGLILGSVAVARVQTAQDDIATLQGALTVAS